jgi:hypothetical protein
MVEVFFVYCSSSRKYMTYDVTLVLAPCRRCFCCGKWISSAQRTSS